MIYRHIVTLVMLTVLSYCIVLIANAHPSEESSYSPIVISGGGSSSSQVNILIHAPDFNSNSYAIDTIGDDGSKVTISTREASIPYRLVETGPDTGDFAGYVILSSSTSECSPVCGPTDGFLAAGGDDGITVSFTYPNGQTISSSSYGQSPTPVYTNAVPEFPLVALGLLAGVMSLVLISKVSFMLNKSYN